MKKVLLLIAVVLSSTMAAQTSQNVSLLRDVYVSLKEGRQELSAHKYTIYPESGWYGRGKVVVQYNTQQATTIMNLQESSYLDMVATIEDAFRELTYQGTTAEIIQARTCKDGSIETRIDPTINQLFYSNMGDYDAFGIVVTVTYNNTPNEWWHTVKIEYPCDNANYEVSPYFGDFTLPCGICEGDNEYMDEDYYDETASAINNQGSQLGNSNTGANKGAGGYGSFNLSGRTIGSGGLPRPRYSGKEDGRIVINITVNPDGYVVSAEIGRGTTIESIVMREWALIAAEQAKFNKIKGSNNQSGTISYTYKL